MVRTTLTAAADQAHNGVVNVPQWRYKTALVIMAIFMTAKAISCLLLTSKEFIDGFYPVVHVQLLVNMVHVLCEPFPG